MPRTRHYTVADVLALPNDGNRYEVVHGELLFLALRYATPKLKTPAGWRTAMRHIRLLFGDRVQPE